MWCRIYVPEVDRLFKSKLLAWGSRDPRGVYYSYVVMTDLGRKIYETNTIGDLSNAEEGIS